MNESELRIRQLEREISEIRGEALLYRQKLEDCYEAERLALQENSVGALLRFAPLPGLRVPPPEEARMWAKDFVHACEIDTRALETAKSSLEKIHSVATQLNVEGSNEYLKQEIMTETKRGRDSHV
jgi:hypothetical protein